MMRLRHERGDGLPTGAPARLRHGYGGQPSLVLGAKVGVKPAEGRPPRDRAWGWGPTRREN
jgi:hypothetical protein